jgi:SAM-dependent methyltransferase
LSALAAAWRRARRGQPRRLLDQWTETFAQSTGIDWNHASSPLVSLPKTFGLMADEISGAEWLFLLQTYFAVLVRLLARQTQRPHRDHGPRPADPGDGSDGAQALERLAPLAAASGESPWPDDCAMYDWFLEAWSAELAAPLGQLAGPVAAHGPPARKGATTSPASGAVVDWLKPLYESLFPRRVRHLLGEYYTPDWLADHMLDLVRFTGAPDQRMLDPACGSGTFLLRAIRRILATGQQEPPAERLPTEEACQKVWHRVGRQVVGFDLNPLAVMAAVANCRMALAAAVGSPADQGLSIERRDTVLESDRQAANARPPHDQPRQTPADDWFDCVAGNPPWIAWDNLPSDYRQATLPLWQHYGLFSLSGNEARHGGAKKDLAMLMLYSVADRYLAEGGRLGLVITQSVFQTKGAGDGFRRFRLGSAGPWLGVLRADDYCALRPFPSAANSPGSIVLEKGRPTTYPVAYVKWRPNPNSAKPGGGTDRVDGDRSPGHEAQLAKRAERVDFLARPVDPEQNRSPWLLLPAELDVQARQAVGRSDYKAHLGANTGGANNVFWVRVLGRTDEGVLIANDPKQGKQTVGEQRCPIEPDLLYPLIRWRDVDAYAAKPSEHIILAQDPSTRRGIEVYKMGRDYPKTLDYLARFEKMLTRRAAYRRYQAGAPFYSMYNVGPYTVAAHKVIWRRMDRRVRAAVVSPQEDPVLGTRTSIPQETCALVPLESEDEAHYLCGLLNSTPAGFLTRAFSVRGGKGFGSPTMLDYLSLRRFDPRNASHARLAALSRAAHRAATAGGNAAIGSELLEAVDVEAGKNWGFGPSELRAVRAHADADSG